MVSCFKHQRNGENDQEKDSPPLTFGSADTPPPHYFIKIFLSGAEADSDQS
jgi:hypothetical protein